MKSPLRANFEVTNSRELEAWRNNPREAEAAELLERASFTGKSSGVEDAAYWVIRNPDRNRAGIVRLAKVALGIQAPIDDMVPRSKLSDQSILRARVKRLKQLLIDHPRDAISRTDLARLYLLLGQQDKAALSMEMAAKSSPDNRFVLRSAAQLYATLSQADRAIRLLWRSDAVKTDPWVQAAEVALADALDISPRFGTKQLRTLMNSPEIGVKHSELAAGLASLEWKAGVKRKNIKKLLTSSLRAPTENTLAQAVWLEGELDAHLVAENLIIKNTSAHEARSRAAYEAGDYQACSASALEWFYDQPFSREAARDYVFVTGIHLDDYETSLAVGAAALRLHPNDFTLLNGQLYASVMAGRLEDAKNLYSRMKVVKSGRDQIPFLQAGAGLIAFAEGNIEEGRAKYAEAIDSAVAQKKPSLVANAYIYWLEREAISGAMSRSEVLKNIEEIDTAVRSLPKQTSSDAMPTWDAKKASITRVVDETEKVIRQVVDVGNGKSVTYTLPARLKTRAMRLD